MSFEMSAVLNLGGNFMAGVQKAQESLGGLGQKAAETAQKIKETSKAAEFGEKISNGLSVAKDAFGAAGIASAAFLKTCVYGAAKAEKTNADLAQTIKSTGGAAGLTADEVSKMAAEISKNSACSTGMIKQGQNMLLTFTNIGKDVFPMATQAMVDMAQKMGGDPVNSSIQLGKALNDPANGLTALTRVGVTFTEEQKKQVQAMQAAGDVAGAQKIILNELNKEFGGQSQAALNTYDGQMNKLTQTIGGIKSSIGSVLLPYLLAIAQKLNSGAQAVSGFVTEHKKLIAIVLSVTAVFGTLIGGVGLFTKIAGFLGPAVTSITGLIGGLSTPILIVIGAIAALFYAYTQNFGGMKDFIDGVIGNIVSAFKSATDAFKNTGSAIAAISAFIGSLFGDDAADRSADVLNRIKDMVMSLINTVKSHLPEIKAIFQDVFNKVADIWNNILKPVLSLMIQAIVQVVNWIGAHWPQIQKIIDTVFKAILSAWNSILKPVLNFIIETIGKVVQWVVANWPLISQTISTVMNAISSIISSVLSAISSFWSAHGATIMAVATNIWEAIKTTVSTVIKVIEDVIKAVMQAINGDWSGAWNSVCDAVGTIFSGAKTIIWDILCAIGNIFKDIAVTAFNWGKDMVMGIVDGIKGAIGYVEDAVKGVGEKIKSYLHFSVPDQGPLTDYETWMPDFMKGMGTGIKVNTHLITEPIKNLTVGIKTNLSDTKDFKVGVNPELTKSKNNKNSDTNVVGTANKKEKKSKICSIKIAKLADSIVVREEADIDKIATRLANKLEHTDMGMA